MKSPKAEKIADYLYYMELDDYSFNAMPDEDSAVFTFGCSSVRCGDLYGRNLDLGYCEIPEFVIRVNAAENRFASIGVCAEPEAVCDVSKMDEDTLFAMPCVTNDGINENGVIISENVVIAEGVDGMSGTAPGKEKVHSSRIVRYLLDRAESAAHAVELMRSIDIVGGFSGYALHWMIADEKDTFVVEIIGGKLSVSRNEKFCMTNFYLNYGPAENEQYIAGNLFRDVPKLSDYPIGVERWCVLRDGYGTVSCEDDMISLLRKVRATAMYTDDNDPLWYTECVDGVLSKDSSKDEFEKEFARQLALFGERDRKDPKGDWITWHSSVYSIKDRSLCVFSQEDFSKDFRFELNG